MFLSSCNFKSLNLFKYICYTRTQRKEIEAHNLVFEPYQRFDAIFFHLEVQFSPTIEDLFLKQHVHEPTNMRTRILGWFGKWARISHFLAKPGDREDDFRFALFVRGTREISPVFLVPSLQEFCCVMRMTSRVTSVVKRDGSDGSLVTMWMCYFGIGFSTQGQQRHNTNICFIHLYSF